MKLLPYLLAAILVMGGCAFAFLHDKIVDEGDLDIIVTQVHQEGWLFKTWEVKVSSGGDHYFTVADPDVLQQVRDCNDCSLRIHYLKRLWTPLQSENGGRFIVTANKELKEK